MSSRSTARRPPSVKRQTAARQPTHGVWCLRSSAAWGEKRHEESKPFLTQILAQFVTERYTQLFLRQLLLGLRKNITTRKSNGNKSVAKLTMASSRLRNSGVNMRFDVSHFIARLARVGETDGGFIDRVSAPALVVMMTTTLRKSALRPLLSVSVPWSITCNNTLKMSVPSQFRRAAAQCRAQIASVNKPPLVKPHVARRANQAAYRVPLHVFGHIKRQLHTHDISQLLGPSVLPAGWAAEEIRQSACLPYRPEQAILTARPGRLSAWSCPDTRGFKVARAFAACRSHRWRLIGQSGMARS